jgi:hypothetical protein
MNTMIQYVRDEKNVPVAIFIADQIEDRVVKRTRGEHK